MQSEGLAWMSFNAHIMQFQRENKQYVDTNKNYKWEVT